MKGPSVITDEYPKFPKIPAVAAKWVESIDGRG
jgi:hypothetical protein